MEDWPTVKAEPLAPGLDNLGLMLVNLLPMSMTSLSTSTMWMHGFLILTCFVSLSSVSPSQSLGLSSSVRSQTSPSPSLLSLLPLSRWFPSSRYAFIMVPLFLTFLSFHNSGPV